MTNAADLPPLPAAFVALLDAVIDPAHRAEVDASYTAPKTVTFRLNPLKADGPATLAALSEAGVPWAAAPCPTDAAFATYCVPPEHRSTLTHHAVCSDGQVYVQGLSSMAAVWALGPQPGEEILDLAAAPGGKTALIAAAMRNQGRLAAVEPVRARFFKLKANLARLGVTCHHTYLKDGAVVGKLTPARFDRVLLDAPCSSEAQFTRLDPESWAHWSPKKVKDSARLQAKLLRSAIAALKPGGVLVYSTCSLSPEENECVLHHALSEHPEMDVTPMHNWPNGLPVQAGLTEWKGQALDPRLTHARRWWPTAYSDAFFVCRLQKAV